jgi:aminoglycoside phosphotransferase (APT) family kinase protein
VSVEFVRQLPGGAVGAALVRLPSGKLAVLSSWPPGSAARAGEVGDLLDRLRVRGYPAPAYLAVVDCGDIVAVVQEFVAGTPPPTADPVLVQALLQLNDRQRSVLPAATGGLAELHLRSDGPGYCLHEPLRRYSGETAALRERVHRIGDELPDTVGSGRDVVHGDFHLGNVLIGDKSGAVAGIVDWTGARGGDAGLDLVVLAFFLDHARAPVAVRAVVEERMREVVEPDGWLAFTAHLALRQVDWAIRHHGPDQVADWTSIAHTRLADAERSH